MLFHSTTERTTWYDSHTLAFSSNSYHVAVSTRPLLTIQLSLTTAFVTASCKRSE